MNTAQCSICTECLDSPSDDISAVQCGHVFHARCLTRWLAESSTCPQCRIKTTSKTVIWKLYFCLLDSHDASFSADGGDNGTRAVAEIRRLNDELATTRGSLTERVHELAKLSAEKRALEQKTNQLTESLRSLENLHQKEVDSNRLLRLQLNTAQSIAREADDARETAAALRRKVNELHNVQTVINGFQNEIEAMIRDTADVTQLATWCTVLKAELAHKRKEYRELNETLQQTKRNLETARSTLSDRNTELSIANSRVADLEADITEQNKQISGLRKKVDALQAALGSPSDTAVGFARRLINESPAPLTLSFQTPKLSAPKNGSHDIDLDTSIDLFATPEPPRKIPTPPPKRQRPSAAGSSTAPSKTVSTVRISTAGNTKVPTAATTSREPQDISNRSVQFALDILGKQGMIGTGTGRSNSSVFREGYNGFGGHEKVIMPRPKLPSKNGSKKTVKKMFGPSKTSSCSTDKTPTLPKLLSFMTNSVDLT